MVRKMLQMLRSYLDSRFPNWLLFGFGRGERTPKTTFEKTVSRTTRQHTRAHYPDRIVLRNTRV